MSLRCSFLTKLSPWTLSAVAAALLAACGGGGSDAGAAAASVDDPTATAYSANATLTASDATGTADTAVLTAQALVAGAASSMASGVATTYNCAGGGTATVSISGGAPANWGNGKFDAGEIYQVSYAACKGAAGWVALDGSATLTVSAASGDSSNGSLALALAVSNLSVTTPRGNATLNGNSTRDITVSTDAAGAVHLSSHYVAPSFTWTTHYQARTSTFTLSAVDIRRDATFVGGVLQSSSIAGTHTLSATLPNGAFSYTVATNGGVTYAADGTPLSGSWTITLPLDLITVTVTSANGIGTATVAIDRGKDGTIDRTFTLTWVQLAGVAG
jgi:hypothetical protein